MFIIGSQQKQQKSNRKTGVEKREASKSLLSPR